MSPYSLVNEFSTTDIDSTTREKDIGRVKGPERGGGMSEDRRGYKPKH